MLAPSTLRTVLCHAKPPLCCLLRYLFVQQKYGYPDVVFRGLVQAHGVENIVPPVIAHDRDLLIAI